MKWRGRQGSRNIEDRRSTQSTKAGGMGIVGMLAVITVNYFLGVDISPLVGGGGIGGQTYIQRGELTREDRDIGEFVSVTLADTEQIWGSLFQKEAGMRYNPATMVLFKGVTGSPCGNASGATGPFYCPADKKVYLDTDFFNTLGNRLGAKCDFAAAYVVAHEVAHHVQNELGILSRATAARKRMSTIDSNLVSVMIELQADCFSGIWARYAEERLGTLERGDLAEAINAAKQIGDDTLQRNAGRRPMPHTFTHGTSEQRQRWFEIGYRQAKMASCDTFSSQRL